ncbi:PREDICTED: transcriptional enhancer factor TEF-3 [Elephantulus edwardii]|uniref:transcriptional enhancer factor TEF-3 n=1 Tax=Elephantulus edwardii TaxID=28737 RepID=UPI0003F0BE08|nr:PREDICTED: transcriptional enhancer factor TEF-3 [Elephantulus edwardii]
MVLRDQEESLSTGERRLGGGEGQQLPSSHRSAAVSSLQVSGARPPPGRATSSGGSPACPPARRAPRSSAPSFGRSPLLVRSEDELNLFSLTLCRPCSGIACPLGPLQADGGRKSWRWGGLIGTDLAHPPYYLPAHWDRWLAGPTGAPPSGALEGKAGTITSNEWSSPNSPEGSNVSGGSQTLDKPIDNDAEGVWSPDIEQSFQEALAIYPPCGRRKIILSDEGKMYGRNELIARYIKLRTGKTRTRKQVSSHIQVLARRKAREIQAKLKDQAAKDKALQSMATMSSAQIISATAFHNKMTLTRGPSYPAVSGFWQGALPSQAGTSHDVKPFSQQTYAVQPPLPLPGFESPAGPAPSPSAPPAPPWQGRSIASSKLWLLEFSAFLERQQDPDTYNKHLFVHIGQSSPSYSDPYLETVDIRQIYDKFPEKKGGLKELFERGPSNAFFLVKFWADLNTNIEDEGSSFYGVSSQYESTENMIITCSTKVCSFGKQVVEKVETEYARYENGHYLYRIHRSPLCEYMINFIHKLKHLPEKYMMNSVLENFTILQVVTNRDTQETLLCIAYVFEVSASEHGAQHHIYRLVKE